MSLKAAQWAARVKADGLLAVYDLKASKGDVMANFDDCVHFANQHMICSLATCDREQPRVRMLGMWFADKRGLYFSTVKTKKIYRELTANRKAEACFYAPPKGPLGQEGSTDIGTMMRASGDVVFLEDPNLKEQLLEQRPFLRPHADDQVIFRIQNGEATFWTSADSGRESALERIRF
jgi:uncharacterized pyridoxamine 5'-phosphate oxidase family protein